MTNKINIVIATIVILLLVVAGVKLFHTDNVTKDASQNITTVYDSIAN